MITHNYYIDYLKAFNIFLMRILNNASGVNLSDANKIQKIEYNIGSKTVLTNKLYGNESYEYPNIIVDLADIRIDDEATKPIQRNLFGLVNSYCTAFPCANYTENQEIYIETRRYILNFNVQINVENSADLLNFYHMITNYTPINFTFVDYSFLYFIDITELTKEWNFENDDIFNAYVLDHGVYTNKIREESTINDKFQRVFTLVEVQPEIELTGINYNIDKENMKYSINMNVLMTSSIPILIYTNEPMIIKRVIIDIDLGKTEYPILMDTALKFQDKNIEKGFMIKSVKNSKDIKDALEIEIVGINFNKITNFNQRNYFLKFIGNYINPNSKILSLPLDKNYFQDKIKFQDNKIILLPEYEQTQILKEFLQDYDFNEFNINMFYEFKENAKN